MFPALQLILSPLSHQGSPRGISFWMSLPFFAPLASLYNQILCTLSCFSNVQLFVTPQTVAHQAPLSMGFSRQEYWSGLPCPPPGDLPHPGIEPVSLTSPAVAGRFFTTRTTWEAPSKSIPSLFFTQHCIMKLYIPYQEFLEIMIVGGGGHSILKDGSHSVNYLASLKSIGD